MRIIFLNHNQQYFGTYWRCYYLALNLSESGHQLIHICASPRPFDLLIRKIKINENYQIITLPRIKYHKYFTGQLVRLFITIPLLFLFRYEVLCAFTVAQPQIAIPAIISKYVLNKKLIIDWDDLWGGGFALEHADLVTKVLSFFEIYTLKYADTITFVSDFLGDKLRKLGYHRNIHKIPNGINTDLKFTDRTTAAGELRLTPNNLYLVSVGNTYFSDGLRFLFSGFKTVLSRKIPAILIMVGYTDIDRTVSDLTDKIRPHLIITGPVSADQVQKYISLADILVLPMGNNDIERARYPIRLGEYLYSRKPVISNAVGEVKTVLSDYPQGIIVSNSSEFADKIVLLRHKKTLQADQRSYKLNKYYWTKIAENFASLL